MPQDFFPGYVFPIIDLKRDCVIHTDSDVCVFLYAGARFVGGEELLLKLKNGLIQKDSDYDYLIAHMDMIQDLNTHLKRKHAVRS